MAVFEGGAKAVISAEGVERAAALVTCGLDCRKLKGLCWTCVAAVDIFIRYAPEPGKAQA